MHVGPFNRKSRQKAVFEHLEDRIRTPLEIEGDFARFARFPLQSSIVERRNPYRALACGAIAQWWSRGLIILWFSVRIRVALPAIIQVRNGFLQFASDLYVLYAKSCHFSAAITGLCFKKCVLRDYSLPVSRGHMELLPDDPRSVLVRSAVLSLRFARHCGEQPVHIVVCWHDA